MKESLIVASVLLGNILTPGFASAQGDQAVGTDFGCSLMHRCKNGLAM